MGKLKAGNPQLSVYYNDRDHVTIIVQTPHKLSVQSPIITHYISSDHTKHILQSAPPVSLPLLRNPRWIISQSEFESTWYALRNPHWHLHQCVVQNHAPVWSQLIVTLALSPTSPLVSTETVHALKLTDVFFSGFMS